MFGLKIISYEMNNSRATESGSRAAASIDAHHGEFAYPLSILAPETPSYSAQHHCFHQLVAAIKGAILLF